MVYKAIKTLTAILYPSIQTEKLPEAARTGTPRILALLGAMTVLVLHSPTGSAHGPSGHEDSGQPDLLGISSAEQHILEDKYWSELAQSYPKWSKESSTQAIITSPSDYDDLGQWSPVITWPHIPVSAANLPDGRVLTWASNETDDFPGGRAEYTHAATWDPKTGVFEIVDHDNHDMFCAHQVVLEDGRIFVAGGRNHVRTTSIFNPVDNSWVEVEDMNNGRWYPTAVAQSDGSVFIGIGSSGGRYPELWRQGLGWLSLGGIDLKPAILDYTSYYEQNWWPFFNVAPTGKIVHYGPTPDMHVIDTTGTGSITNVGPHNGDWYPKHGGVTMYDEGKILVAGGARSGGDLRSTNKSMIVDINGPTPQVTPIAPMIYERKFQNAIVLPNGQVLIVGGNTSGTKFSDAGTVLAAEVWNPETQLWTELADMDVPRNYHSIALLLTDGRVLAAGGGLCGGCSANHQDGQIFSPPYLFNPDGSLAARPQITSAPSSVGLGTVFPVQATSGIGRFTMIKMSSTTHAVNTDVRFINVDFLETTPGEYELTSHSNQNVLTPGPYMLFALSSDGVPSEAAVVNVSTDNRTPDMVDPGSQFDIVNTSVSLPIEASDPDGDSLAFSATGLPPGLVIDPATGLISGQPNTLGVYNVRVYADDGKGGVQNVGFDWTITIEGGPSAWLNADVGNVQTPGQFNEAGGTFTIEGSGSDIWDDRDGFHYVYQSMSGDGELTARVASLEVTHPWSRAGVMIRDDLLAKSPYALMQVTGERGIAFQYRRQFAAYAEPAAAQDWTTTAPHWVRIVRTGNEFFGYHSANGTDWILRGSVVINMPSTVYIGMAVTSHDNSTLATAVFDSVSLRTGIDDNDAPTAPTNLVATAVASDTIDLSWDPSDDGPGGSGVARYDIFRDGSSAPIASTSSTGYSDGGLTENTLYTYQVSAIDLAGNESLLSDPASATTPVPPTNSDPVLVNPGNQQHVEGEDVSIPVSASDPDGDTLTFSGIGLPPGIQMIATTGHMEGVATTAGTFNVEVSVDDGKGGSDSASFVWTITAPEPDTTPPVTPGGLSVSGVTSTSISLQWSPSTDEGGSGLAGYKVYRDGGPVPVAQVTTPDYVDSGLQPNTHYTYQVQAYDGAGNDSGMSVAASATTLADSSPTDFLSADVGAVAAAGGFSETDGVFTVTGSGYDIWNTRDEFHYVYKSLVGDGELTARVLSLENTHVWARAGVMIRESLLAKSPYAMMQVTAGRGIAFQYRETFEGDAGPPQSHDDTTQTPHWIRIRREGALITGYHSADGVTWIERDSITISMPQEVHIGLAVTSHNDGVLTTAVFDNVSDGVTTPDTDAPSTPDNLIVTSTDASSIQLDWSDSVDTGGSGLSHYNIYRDGLAAPYATATTSDFSDSGLAALTQYRYQVTAVDQAGNESAKSVEAVATTSANPLLVSVNSNPPAEINTSISYTADSSGSVDRTYSWNFGDGSPSTTPSASNTATHAFATAGRYVVTVTVTGSDGQSVTDQVWQAIHQPLTASRPAHSSSIAYEQRTSAADRIWNVNPDNDSVSVFDSVNHIRIAEIPVGDAPRSIGIAPDGSVWVSNAGDGSISIIDASSLAAIDTIDLPGGSRPFGLVFDPVGNHCYVALEATGVVLKLNVTTRVVAGNVPVGPDPRHLGITADGTRLYVSRFITAPLANESNGVPTATEGGTIVVVDTSSMAESQSVSLRISDAPDSEHAGRGVPNYLGPTVISPDGQTAWVPSKQDNVMRGSFRDGQNLTHDSTVRAIASRINLVSNSEEYAARFDFDDGAVPSNAAFGPFGSYLFTVLEGSRQVSILEPFGDQELLRYPVGRAPQGIVISPDGRRAYVHNFMDRSISVLDIDNVVNEGGQSVSTEAVYDTVAIESLDPQILLGKQHFYDAADSRLAMQAYVSCAACHNDGGDDGRVWDLSGFGEGLRNTVNLRAQGGSDNGPLHWTANFDEVQDFERQIRELSGGTGLMSDVDYLAGTRSEPLGDPKAGFSADLDALAAYVNSLNAGHDSPFRNADGSLTADAVTGAALFDSEGCASCHQGAQFSDSGIGGLHDIGTITAASGQRLSQPLTGFDTPTLRSVWESAPYLHDGSAATLQAAIDAHAGVNLAAADLDALASYLRQVDATSAPPPPPPDSVSPTDPTSLVGSAASHASIDLSWTGSEDSGGSGLAGYRIYRNSGSTPVATVTGTTYTDSGLAASTAYSYHVTAIDNAGNESGNSNTVSIATLPAPDTTAPSVPQNLSGTSFGQNQIDLSWTDSTDSGGSGLAGYNVYRGPSSTPIASVTSAGYSDTGLSPDTGYTYYVTAFDGAGNESGPSTSIFVSTEPPPPDTTPPTAPAGLTASAAGSNQVDLAWTASTDSGGSGLAGYRIFRDGSPAPIATTTATVYSDSSGLTENTLYTYQVAAFDSAGNESLLSDPASATTAPEQTWQNTDVGGVSAAGSYSVTDGVMSVLGSGYDIWKRRDEFHYVYQELDGDGELTALVENIELTHVWSRAGVMIRENLLAKSPYAFMQVTGGKGIAFHYRSVFAGDAGPDKSHDDTTTAPIWLKIVRSGDILSGYYSADGTTWTFRDSVTIAMPQIVYIGLAVSSHDDGVLATGTFSNITLQ